LAEGFRIIVEPDEQDERRSAADSVAQLGHTQEWLDRLMRRITDGLSRGTYRQLPHVVPEEAPGGDMTTPVRLLAQLLSPHEGLIDAIWMDDRFVNQFRSAGSVRIVDLLEVLAILEARGSLSPDRIADLSLAMRAANVRYLPLAASELVRHLEAAPIVQGRVTETRALTILRRSVAATLVDRASLRIPAVPVTSPDALGEFPYLLSLNRATMDGIVEVWRRTRSEVSDLDAAADSAAARARWIVDNLALDLGLLRAVVVHPDHPPDVGVSAAGLAALIGYAIRQLDERATPGEEPQDEWARRYLDWVWRAVVEPRLVVDPSMRAQLVARVGQQLSEPPDERRDDPMVVRVARLLAGRLYDVMPRPLQDELSKDPALLEFAAREVTEVYGDGDHSFPARVFVEAVTAALGGEAQRVTDTLGRQVALERAAPPGVFQLRVDGQEQARVVGDPAFLVLAEDVATRLEAVRRLGRELDMEPAVERELRDAILGETDGRARLGLIQRRRSESLYARYGQMEKRLRTTRQFRHDELEPPTISSMLAHLRLPTIPTDGTSHADWDTSATSLIQELGLEEAAHRLSGLPVSLPSSLISGVASLDANARRRLIKRNLRRPTSPLGYVQGMRLLAGLGAADPAARRLLRRLARHLGSERWTQEVAVFKQILSNSIERLELRPDSTGQAEAALITTWYHAHRVTSAFLAAGADPSPLTRLLSRVPSREWTSYFGQARLAWMDVAHPRHLRPARLALAGAAYALNDAPDGVLNEDLVSVLLARLTLTAEQRAWPVVDLLLDSTKLTDTLRSFLVFDTDDLGSAFARDRVPIFAGLPAKARMAEDAVASLERDPTDLGSWLTLYLVAEDAPLASSLEARLLDALRTVDLTAVVATVGSYAPLPIFFACSGVARGGTDADRERLLDQLTVLAKPHRANPGSAATETQDQTPGAVQPLKMEAALLEGAYALSRAETSPQGAVRRFVTALTTFAEADPAWWPRLRPMLESLVGGLSLDLAHWLTPMLLHARAATPASTERAVASDTDEAEGETGS
jgi:hypothetical protein